MTGSSRMGLAWAAASRNQARPAILKASSDESTSWLLPSVRVTLRSTAGNPASTPLLMASRMPSSTGLTNSLGTAPPVTVESNSYSPPGWGSSVAFTTANWPEPPVCLRWV